MVEPALLTMSSTRRLWRRWRWLLLIVVPILILALIYAAELTFLQWQADRRYLAAAAELDRVDPGWRLDDLLAHRQAVPDDVNSALRLRDVANALPPSWPGTAVYDSYFPGYKRAAAPGPEQLVEIRAKLTALADAVARARSLADMPRGRYDWDRPTITRYQQVPGRNAYTSDPPIYPDDVRRVCHLLQLDVIDRIDRGDIEGALIAARAILNAGGSVGDYPTVYAQGARSGMTMLAVRIVEQILQRGEATDQSLAAFQALLEDEARQPRSWIAIRGERAVTDEFFEKIRAGTLGPEAIPGWGEMPLWGRPMINRSSLRDNQTNLLRMHTQLMQVAALPVERQADASKSLLEVMNKEWSEDRYWERLRRTPETQTLGGGLWGQTDSVVQAYTRTAIVALACERYRLAHGRWPDRLEQLVPEFLPRVPADPFASGALKLRRFPHAIFVYSVGWDRHDDGGSIDEEWRAREGADQGFRLWDEDHRPPPAKAATTATELGSEHSEH